MTRAFITRRLLPVTVVFGILVTLLALDLANHGLAWRWMWSVTGEEKPFAQIKGTIEWLGNFTRVQPHTDPLTPVDHTWENPYGVNTFLQQEVEIPKIERELQMIHDAGFYWLRQEFPWADIEVDGRGKFTDSRNDMNGDGQADTVDAWAKYDRIVNLVEKYDLHLQVRLSSPPKWTHANPDKGDFAPPDDTQDYVSYAAAVATRYKGRIHYYQVWNEPNIYPEWGNQAVDAAAYTDLLCRTYKALKAVDPEIVVLSGALAPTNALDRRDLSDFIFLQQMYDLGAGQCFDVLSMQGYGLNSGPTDRRMRVVTVNFSRNLYIRDIMVANNDSHKPIWISEAAWNAIPDDPSITGYGQYGKATQEQAARYMPLAYQRAREEWPWVGVINYWFFTRPNDAEKNQAFYYFRMVEPDYRADKPDFTPLPVYTAVKDYIQNQLPVLYAGVHQAESWAVSANNKKRVATSDASLGAAVDTSLIRFTVYGTDVIVRSRPNSSSAWQETHTHIGLTAHEQDIEQFSTTPFQVDTITILDRTYENLFPYLAGLAILIGMTLLVIVRALRERRG